MRNLLSEIRQAARALARTPGLSLAAVVTLALGAGSTIAIGTLVYSILWRPIPGSEPQRRVLVYPTSRGALSGENDALALVESDEIAASGAVERLAVLTLRSLTLTGDEPQRIVGASVSPDFFRVLGVAPLLGRDFRDDEGQRFGNETSAILTHSFWLRRFAGDPRAIGRSIEINQRVLTVIGVLPPGFSVPSTQQVYLPWAPDPSIDRRDPDWWTVAVLPRGADPRRAQAALDAAAVRLRHSGVVSEPERGFRLVPLRAALYDPHTVRISAVLASLVFAVLAVACFNVANLLFARIAGRRNETAIRLALGSGRGRILRQVLVESLLLSAAGCAGGLLLGKWGLDLALSTMHEELPAWMSFALDGRLVAGTIGLSIVATILAGLAPALAAAREGSHPVLAAGGRTVSRRSRVLQRWLVALQFSASFLVLAVALWLLSSVRALERAPLGFDPSRLLSFRTYLPGDAYDPDDAKRQFRVALVERLTALPGVAGAAVTTALPADDGGAGVRVSRAEDPPTEEASIAISQVGVSRGFFDTLGAPLLAGETWSNAADSGAPDDRVVINTTLAEKLWPGASAIGRRLRVGLEPDAPVYTVSGLAPRIPIEEVHEQTSRSGLQLFVPYARIPWRTSFVVVRAASGDPASLAGPARRALRELEPDAPIYEVLTYPARLRQSWEDRTLIGRLATIFAAQGGVLAAIGLFGVLADAIGRRRREIGLRMALGAAPRRMVAAVVGDGLRFSLPGVAVGLALVLVVARLARNFFFGVDPTAPRPLAAALALLLAVAGAASWLAARRAAGVDPATALREE